MTLVAFDPGASATKGRTATSSVSLASTVALHTPNQVQGLAGLRTRKRPLTITTAQGEFWTGPGAHDFGRPVENLDFERLTGAPEMRALFYAALTQLFPHDATEPLMLLVGLPIAALAGNDAPETLRRVKEFLSGPHQWQADGQPHTAHIQQVVVTGQPVGALFEYFLQPDGTPHPARRADYMQEVGVLNLGFSTVDLLTSRQGQLIERLTGGEALGVQDMLAETSRATGHTLAELNEQLRRGKLETRELLPIWERRVFGYLDKVWPRDARQRFARVIATGGGAYLLKDALLRRFGARLYLAADPVLATAEGLYRFGLKQGRRAALPTEAA